MANKPITRFEVQYVTGDAYLRWTSTRAHLMTGRELIEELREIADGVERFEYMEPKEVPGVEK